MFEKMTIHNNLTIPIPIPHKYHTIPHAYGTIPYSTRIPTIPTILSIATTMKTTFPLTSETVCASAPGKAILFGEHAVVYGHPAIAAALSDLRITVWITPVQSGTNGNTIKARDEVRIRLADLPQPVDTTLSVEFLRSLPTLALPPQPHVTAAQLTELLEKHTRNNNTQQQNAIAQSALLPVVYLLAVLLYGKGLSNTDNHHHHNKNDNYRGGLEIYVAAPDLPVGAGLGSSAAFSVALAAALLQYVRRRRRRQQQQPAVMDLDTVNQYAYYAEILLHGQPSGLDNAVATYGGALKFAKSSDTQGQTQWEALLPRQEDHAGSSLPPMLLVHTHVPRSTKALVSHVRQQYEAYPTVVAPILQAMGALAEAFAQEQKQTTGTSAAASRRLLDYVSLNHALLRAVGVSHPALEDVVARVAEACPHGGAAAKLTGAGGGGCALVVGDALKAAERALTKDKTPYTCWRSTLGGPGVQWHKASDTWNQVVGQGRQRPKQSSREGSRWKVVGVALMTIGTAALAMGTMGWIRQRSR